MRPLDVPLNKSIVHCSFYYQQLLQKGNSIYTFHYNCTEGFGAIWKTDMQPIDNMHGAHEKYVGSGPLPQGATELHEIHMYLFQVTQLTRIMVNICSNHFIMLGLGF